MKIQHINVMELPEDILNALNMEEPIVESEHGTLDFVERYISYHGNGYFNDLVVFKCNGKTFRFMAINYLDDYWTFTKPYEVFQEEVTRKSIVYTTWYEPTEEIS